MKREDWLVNYYDRLEQRIWELEIDEKLINRAILTAKNPNAMRAQEIIRGEIGAMRQKMDIVIKEMHQ